MPRTSIVDSDKAKAAVNVLIRAPGITVSEAMILAKFTEEEANTKLMQRKVSRDLQKKTESKGKANATVSAADSVPPVEDVDFNGNESPHDMSSMTEEEWKPKKHRLNANQKQEKREAELRAKAKFSQAHKAATKLYAADARGLPHIPREKLCQLLNFDETSLSLDGSSINRGGRPAAYWFDPRLPQVGITTAKTAYSSTMITGSNAYGEALPPHFQFTSSAQTDEGKMITEDCICYMKKVRGVFGMGGASEESFGATIGLNEKGGMDMEEFAKYLRNSIMPLYPNAAPEFGKWVILKCDSGPGRPNLDLLADLRSDGFILFPGVPNTTAVLQETDQNYGPFKTQYCKNLDAVVDERLKKGKSTATD
jgi:hypothetical protein